MNEKQACPLTPALLELLQASVSIRSVHSRALAARLFRSPNTIDTEFKRICEQLDVHSRTDAVLMALERGWVAFPAPKPDADVQTP